MKKNGDFCFLSSDQDYWIDGLRFEDLPFDEPSVLYKFERCKLDSISHITQIRNYATYKTDLSSDTMKEIGSDLKSPSNSSPAPKYEKYIPKVKPVAVRDPSKLKKEVKLEFVASNGETKHRSIYCPDGMDESEVEQERADWFAFCKREYDVAPPDVVKLNIDCSSKLQCGREPDKVMNMKPRKQKTSPLIKPSIEILESITNLKEFKEFMLSHQKVGERRNKYKRAYQILEETFDEQHDSEQRGLLYLLLTKLTIEQALVIAKGSERLFSKVVNWITDRTLLTSDMIVFIDCKLKYTHKQRELSIWDYSVPQGNLFYKIKVPRLLIDKINLVDNPDDSGLRVRKLVLSQWYKRNHRRRK